MSRIEDMIRALCPDGVRWVKLGEVCEIKRGVRVVKSELDSSEGYPVYQNSLSVLGYYPEYNTPANTAFVISAGAAGKIGYSDRDFWAADDCLRISCPEDLIGKYVYYCMLNNEKYFTSQVRKASVPRLSREVVERFEIPLPPLPIQEKIVEILEKFSLLSAELEAELEGRRKQYDFYRNRLLSFDSGSDSVQWKALGEVGEFIKGSGILKSDFVEDGLPCIHYGQVHTRFNTFAYKNISSISEELYTKCKKAHTGDLIIASTSEDVEACCKAVAWLGDYDVAVSGDAHIFRHNQNPKYVAYLFQTNMFQTQKRPCANGAKVVRVKSESMAKFVFPFPPLTEQERIVRILDKFEALVTDLSAGLPAEIERVQKQYEYYRNKLLTFPEA